MTEPGIHNHIPGVDESAVGPNYSLGEDELRLIEERMIDAARTVAEDSMVVAWVDPRHPFSNFLRTKEAQRFPEVDGIDDYYEEHQRYIALIDTRGEGGVVHAATIMEFDDAVAPESVQRTGYYTIDSLIALGNFTKAEFLAYYTARGIDLSACISVETNFKIDDDVEPYLGLGTADLTYITLFNLLIDRQVPKDRTLLFASVNAQQAKSLTRNSIEFEYLMARSDFKTEEEGLGKESLPVAITFASGYNLLAPIAFKLPEIHFDL